MGNYAAETIRHGTWRMHRRDSFTARLCQKDLVDLVSRFKALAVTIIFLFPDL